jgi:hypothetical protein
MFSVDRLEESFRKLGFNIDGPKGSGSPAVAGSPCSEPPAERFVSAEELPQALNNILTGKGKLIKKKIKPGGTKALTMSKNIVLNVKDVYDDDRFSKSRKYRVSKVDRSRQEDIWRARSLLVVTVRDHNDKVIGCIEMINKKCEKTGEIVPFNKTDETLAKMLCKHCSIFLEQISDDIEDIQKILNTALGENK